jgi:uncharacterized hydrophobic protein (TIGR00341 family)
MFSKDFSIPVAFRKQETTSMVEPPEHKEGTPKPNQVFLLQELLEFAPRADILDYQLVILTVLAGLVALGGLFLNNVAVIIGAMVISPLLEPIYAGTVFLANGSVRKFLQHAKVLVVLIVILITVSALVTAGLSIITTLPVTPEILSRLEYQEVSAILAILLGITAIVAHKRGFVAAVIGIGISVALVPPAVVTGITMILLPEQVFDALSLTLNNIFGLYAGMLIAILVIGVGPRDKRKMQLTRTNVYLMALSIAGLLLIVFLILRILRHTL